MGKAVDCIGRPCFSCVALVRGGELDFRRNQDERQRSLAASVVLEFVGLCAFWFVSGGQRLRGRRGQVSIRRAKDRRTPSRS
jgi:hypothetical protein